MIDLAELEQYFPSPNENIPFENFIFRISLEQDQEDEVFIVNLKIRQRDTKEDQLIKFRMGIGKDKETGSEVHDTEKPHFEIDIYKRQKVPVSATVYFTFDDAEEDRLLGYAKGTVSIISKIISNFFKTHQLDMKNIRKIIYEEAVDDELKEFEQPLIEALYQCYKKSRLVLRDGKEAIVIRTEHNLKKYLGQEELEPLFLPLLDKIKASK